VGARGHDHLTRQLAVLADALLQAAKERCSAGEKKAHVLLRQGEPGGAREKDLARMALPGLLLRTAVINQGSVPRI
jgi:hypothetical protein